MTTETQSIRAGDGISATPASRWAAEGVPDPHGDRYACERAALTLGDLTDDELANGAFLNYDRPLNIRAIQEGRADYHPPIVWMTAVKDRIRWLSRALEQANAAAPAVSAPAEWRKAVQEAYGWLWHINNEPLAPIPLLSEGKAAYQARKALRDLLTSAERGEAINAVTATIDNIVASSPATGDAP